MTLTRQRLQSHKVLGERSGGVSWTVWLLCAPTCFIF
jgi:hypothetical protein